MDALSEGKRLCVLTIPDRTALELYSPGTTTRLHRELSRIAVELDFDYIDLLPLMAEQSGEFFLECDPHWNALGNRIAAEEIRKKWSYYSRRQNRAMDSAGHLNGTVRGIPQNSRY